ncbi:Amastin surface glycofamily protein [Leishmania donovani]|uniref:Amastin surface glycofamily protein n=1 Tax=Leishmania donovani TaxID=5661 RepID=A0A504XD35_LEIDO|nr:Amastin surface glycofamily protein [Leishmania donovani]
MALKLGVIIYVVLQFIALLCVMIGTGVDMFYLKHGPGSSARVCVTLWGAKSDCRGPKITNPSDKRWASCPIRRRNFRIGQAFAVITIFVYGLAFLFGFLLLYCCSGFRWLCLALNIVGAVTACVVWAVMAVTYRVNEEPNCTTLNLVYNFGTGFGLFVFAWILGILDIIFLMVPLQIGESGEGAEPKEQEKESQKAPEEASEGPDLRLANLLSALAGHAPRPPPVTHPTDVSASALEQDPGRVPPAPWHAVCPDRRLAPPALHLERWRVRRRLRGAGPRPAPAVGLRHGPPAAAHERAAGDSAEGLLSGVRATCPASVVEDGPVAHERLAAMARETAQRAGTLRCEASKMALNLGVIIYVVLQFIAFLCVLIGTGVDMFYIKPGAGGGAKICVTLWGAKSDCRGPKVTNPSDKRWELCPRIRNNFRVGQAFAVITIFVYGLAFLFGFLLLYCCSGFRWPCLALNIVGAVTACVVWAVMAVTYRIKEPKCEELSIAFVYGTGFGLFVFAWILGILDIIFLMVPLQIGESGEGAEPKEQEKEASEGPDLRLANLLSALAGHAPRPPPVTHPTDVSASALEQDPGRVPPAPWHAVCPDRRLAPPALHLERWRVRRRLRGAGPRPAPAVGLRHGPPAAAHERAAGDSAEGLLSGVRATCPASVVEDGPVAHERLAAMARETAQRAGTLRCEASKMALNLGVIIYVVLQFIAFLCVLIGTGVDMFYIKPGAGGGAKICVTLWGAKSDCRGPKVTNPSDKRWELCPRIRNNFRVGQAFAVITIFVYGLAFLFGFLLLYCCSGFRWPCLALNIVGAVTACVVWAVMAVTYRIKEPKCEELSIAFVYGTGFGLFVFAWILGILDIIFLMVPLQIGESGEGAEPKEQEKEASEGPDLRLANLLSALAGHAPRPPPVTHPTDVSASALEQDPGRVPPAPWHAVCPDRRLAPPALHLERWRVRRRLRGAGPRPAPAVGLRHGPPAAAHERAAGDSAEGLLSGVRATCPASVVEDGPVAHERLAAMARETAQRAGTLRCEASKMALNLGVIIYVVLQFIAFLCVLIGTGVDMFYIKPGAGGGAKICVTLWGAKSDCRGPKVTNPSDKRWELCPRIRNNFRVGQAFAVITIFVYGLAFLFGFLLLYCCSGFRWLCLALNIVGAVTACVVWAVMAVTYRIKEPKCEELSIAFVYGTGFGLFVFAWILGILDIIFLMVPLQIGRSDGRTRRQRGSSSGTSSSSASEGPDLRLANLLSALAGHAPRPPPVTHPTDVSASALEQDPGRVPPAPWHAVCPDRRLAPPALHVPDEGTRTDRMNR